MHRVPKSNFGHLFFTSQLVIARWHAHATQGLKKNMAVNPVSLLRITVPWPKTLEAEASRHTERFQQRAVGSHCCGEPENPQRT